MFFEGNDLYDVWRYEKEFNRWEQVKEEYSSFKVRSCVYNAMRHILNLYWNTRQSLSHTYYGAFNHNGQKPDRLYFGYQEFHLTSDDMKALSITGEILTQAFSICKSRSIRLIVAFVPTKYRVYRPLCAFSESAIPSTWVLNDLPRRLERIVANIDSEIGFIDLTEPFRQKAESGALLYFPDDTHWSPEGHELAAEVLGSYLGK